MDKKHFNLALNKLKDKYPEKLILIEGLQRAFNRDVPVISKDMLRALYQYPVQFIDMKPLPNGEWTTALHEWAENGLEDLLEIDPLYLATKNSNGDTVLMALVEYAVGSTTEQINYDFLKKLLSKPMTYKYKINDTDEPLDGCVWDIRDVTGRTPIDYLTDMASGTGTCAGCEPIPELAPYIAEWADNELERIPEVNETPSSAELVMEDSDNVDDEIVDEPEEDLEIEIPEDAKKMIEEELLHDPALRDTGMLKV